MTTMKRCEVRDVGGALEVTVHGAADVAGARELLDELSDVVRRGRDVVVVLDALERLDGAGVQLLLALKAAVERDGGAMCVEANAEVPAKVLDTVGARTMFPLTRSRLGSAGAPADEQGARRRDE